ncbi:MAG TPA: (E)-4-hydroxy-3-methylbut-2-enyl-diphosphate synthase [Chitinophagaceae bacterium]|nr:(E)-4-hydroxy-3-methylbut-2-enyl-diphosphate synthase [Chitinophagaceae bacterium]
MGNRLKTREITVGDLIIGNNSPIRIQTMTTTDTMDTLATVEQSIRCIEAGAELVRITAPSKKEAENLLNIKNELRSRGYKTPLVADIHFTPNAAEIAARIVEKVRVNPGNYVDKKKFEFIDYTDQDYKEEIDRIRERFTPLITICKEYGTAMRIGTNHGSLSDRIMSRYGDTPMGMVESAMEFLRIARDENYHNIVLSMKSSNPQVMVQAYRLLAQTMTNEFGECYPLHLGVTEAGDGEDGRIKSAIGIGTLLEDGIGDTIRVSLTEDPEFEIPVCRDIVKRYSAKNLTAEGTEPIPTASNYSRRKTRAVSNIGDHHVPVVIADFMLAEKISPKDLESIGYKYDAALDKWHISDAAADYLYTSNKILDFELPGTLKVICDHNTWINCEDKSKYFPLFQLNEYQSSKKRSSEINFVVLDSSNFTPESAKNFDSTVTLCVYSTALEPMASIRNFVRNLNVECPVIIAVESHDETIDEQLIHFSAEAGALFLHGIGDGLWLINDPKKFVNQKVSGRTYLETKNNHQFLNNTSFSILQATRTRISKTEYISCPSCGRTLFDLQETTAKIRAVTNHLKGVKIAIMGCIVNGPGEMADADFGYVGSGPGKITLYRGKEVVKRNVDSSIAVDELINLLKSSEVWIEREKELEKL